MSKRLRICYRYGAIQIIIIIIIIANLDINLQVSNIFHHLPAYGVHDGSRETDENASILDPYFLCCCGSIAKHHVD